MHYFTQSTTVILFLKIFSEHVTKVVANDEEYEQAHKLDLNEKERFSEYLIRKGVLSPKMLQQLHHEFLGKTDQPTEQSNDFDSTSKRKINKRKVHKRK